MKYVLYENCPAVIRAERQDVLFFLTLALILTFVCFSCGGRELNLRILSYEQQHCQYCRSLGSYLHRAVHACSNDESAHISTGKQVTGLCKPRQHKCFKIVFAKIMKWVFKRKKILMPWSMHTLTEFNLNEGYCKRYLQ